MIVIFLYANNNIHVQTTLDVLGLFQVPFTWFAL